jgi:hypothetical protein
MGERLEDPGCSLEVLGVGHHGSRPVSVYPEYRIFQFLKKPPGPRPAGRLTLHRIRDLFHKNKNTNTRISDNRT